MSVEHPNFYENLKEALMRLRSTVVLYDGKPVQIHAICNHMKDGIFRVYMTEIGLGPIPENKPFFMSLGNASSESPNLGPYLDDVLAGSKGHTVLRKQMNSPKFNKFRPFPLGMCNLKGQGTFYIERQPNRKTEQGLIRTMLYETHISTSGDRSNENLRRQGQIELNSAAVRACILADHPSAQECLTQLKDPKVKNEAAAFHRDFAFARGPIDMMFLAYKGDIIGVLPESDLRTVRLGREFKHCREVVQELHIFNHIA